MTQLLAWTTRVLALCAAGLAAYLLYASASSSGVVGCTWSAFDCDAALGSRWGKWFGVPVAAGGLLCYLTALAGSVLAGRDSTPGSIGWRLLEAMIPLAVGAGVWFVGVQLVALESFCLYCLLTHAAGLLMAVAAIGWRQAEQSGTPDSAPVGLSLDGSVPTGGSAASHGPPAMGLPTVAGLVGLIALAGGQLLGPGTSVADYEAKLEGEFRFEEPAEADPEAAAEPVTVTAEKPVTLGHAEPKFPARQANGSRQLSLLGGKLTIDAYDHPVLGSPEAPHLVVELMDYACPHCRKFHDKLTEAIERFDGQVGVVVMFVPGEISCNPYVRKAKKKAAGSCYAAKLSLAVSRLRPERFERFHHWMLQDDERVPSRTASLIEAQRHVDRRDLSRELRDEDGEIDARIGQYVNLAAALMKAGKFGMPSQILGNRVISGPPDTVDQVCDTWSEAFGIDEPGSNAPEKPPVELPF